MHKPVVTDGLYQFEIDQRVFDLYDEYCHGRLDRRDFLARAAAITALGGLGLGMAQALLPNYAKAQTISFTDSRIKANYVQYDSPGGNSGTMRGYLVRPTVVATESDTPTPPTRFPAVLVIHENRGLNPYIEDVARRLASAGFLALAPDGLFPLGGYPGNDDDGRVLQAKLDQAKLRVDFLNSARFLKSHEWSNGQLGVTGFCYGGGTSNFLAAELGSELQAAAPYYGVAAALDAAPRIKAPLCIHLAENDERVNSTYPAFEDALKKAKIAHEIHRYKGTQHGFHNNSTPRYDKAAAELSWQRTLAHFGKHLTA